MRKFLRLYSESWELKEETKKHLMAITEKSDNINKFISLIQRHKNSQSLNEAVMIELIDKITVHQKDPTTNTQQIDIHYNFIGKT